MPRMEGTGFSGAGGWNGQHVPLPQGTVKHRGRPPQKPSGFVVHDPREFAPSTVRKALSAPERKPSRRRGRDDGLHGLSMPQEIIDATVSAHTEGGLSISQTAEVIGVSTTTVKKYLRSAGVELRHMRGKKRVDYGTKECLVCGVKFERRPREKADSFKGRVTCGAKCGGVLSWRRRRPAEKAWEIRRMTDTLTHPFMAVAPSCVDKGRHPTRDCGCRPFRTEQAAREYVDGRSSAA